MTPEITRIVSDQSVIDHLIRGLFCTVDTDEYDPEALVHIREAFWIFNVVVKVKDYLYLCIEMGLAEFMFYYDEVAVDPRIDNRLPTLSEFIRESGTDVPSADPNIANVFKNLIYANEACKLELFDYNSTKVSSAWITVRDQYNSLPYPELRKCNHKHIKNY